MLTFQDNKGSSQFRRGWADFEANKEGFPNGLKHAIIKIRGEHNYIQHIAVWHAMVRFSIGVHFQQEFSHISDEIL